MSQETLACARCGKSIPPGEAKFGQPLIKAGELVRIALKTPALLAGPPLDEVPYCAECRLLVARERTNEQLKFLGGAAFIVLLLVLLLFVVL